MLIQPIALRKLTASVFEHHGVSKEDAKIVSDVLVEANLRGHDSHGVVRVPKWIEGIKAGAINPACQPSLITNFGAIGVLDGDRGLGPVVANRSIMLAMEKARSFGLGAISVCNSAHIGMLAWYAEKLANARFIGLVTTNTEPGVAPHGAVDKLLGTNPLALACPTRDRPIVLDMSTSVVARGKIVLAQRAKKSIPEGWAIDASGQATTDPTEALNGALLPVGGPKGSGLSVFVDILSGALSGSEVGKGVAGTMNMSNRSTKGDFFLAINPGVFVGDDKFTQKVEDLRTQIRAARPAKGFDKVMVPGDFEHEEKARRTKEIVIDEVLFREIDSLA